MNLSLDVAFNIMTHEREDQLALMRFTVGTEPSGRIGRISLVDEELSRSLSRSLYGSRCIEGGKLDTSIQFVR